MGYFAYAYIVEGAADEDGVTLSTSILTDHLDSRAFFSWAEGERAPGLHPYASGTLHSSVKLSPLPGYPRTERIGDREGEHSDLVFVDESFTPREDTEPVLFHFVLPPRFIPRPNATPLQVPSAASVIRRGESLSATFVAKGGGNVRFWMARLAEAEKLSDYDLERIFDAPALDSAKVTFEVNLGVIKISLGNR